MAAGLPMEKKEMNDSTSRHQLLPLLYPGSPTTTNVTRTGKSHHQHYSRSRAFQTTQTHAHFISEAGSGCKAGLFSYQQPPALLSQTTHAHIGVGSNSNTASHGTLSGCGCAAESSSLLPKIHSLSGVGVSSSVVDGGSFACVALPGYSYSHMPTPSSLATMALDPVHMLGGGHTDFFFSPDIDLASMVGSTPKLRMKSRLSLFVGQVSSESGLSAPPLTQRTASIDFGLSRDYLVPPLSLTLHSVSRQVPSLPAPKSVINSTKSAGKNL